MGHWNFTTHSNGFIPWPLKNSLTYWNGPLGLAWTIEISQPIAMAHSMGHGNFPTHSNGPFWNSLTRRDCPCLTTHCTIPIRLTIEISQPIAVLPMTLSMDHLDSQPVAMAHSIGNPVRYPNPLQCAIEGFPTHWLHGPLKISTHRSWMGQWYSKCVLLKPQILIGIDSNGAYYNQAWFSSQTRSADFSGRRSQLCMVPLPWHGNHTVHKSTCIDCFMTNQLPFAQTHRTVFRIPKQILWHFLSC